MMKTLLAKLLRPLERIHIGEKNHFLFWAGLAFWGGCVLAAYVKGGWWLAPLLAVTLAVFVLLALKGAPVELALIPAMMVLAMMYTTPRLGFDAPPALRYEQIEGYVYGAPRVREDHRVTFTLANYTLDGQRAKGRAYCTVYFGDEEMPQLFDGAKLRFSGRLYIPGEKSGAPRFDFRRWLMRSGMNCGISISDAAGVEVLNTPETAPWKDWSWRLRNLFVQGLERTMGEEAGIASAMLLGEKENVSEVEYAAFQNLGVAHVLAVSGLHVAMLGALVMAVLKRLIRRPSARIWVLAVFLLFYSGVTGFSPSSLRAAFMLLINEGCALMHRKRDPLTVFGFSLMLVLLFDPVQATAAGFILSFAAVGGIVIYLPGFRYLKEKWLPSEEIRFIGKKRLKDKLHRLGLRCVHGLLDVLAVSLSAQLGTLLPVMYYYHSLPLYGLLVNMLVVPFVGVLLPLFGLALLTCWIPWVGSGVGFVASFLSRGLMWALEGLSQLPYATIRVATPSYWWMVCGVGILLCLGFIFRANWKQRAAAIALLAAVATAGTFLTKLPDTRYVQLAVGQGDAAMLFAGDETVAIDVGADGTATMDYLSDAGRDLDALILTHLHLDRMGGVSALLESGFKVDRVYLPVNGDKQALDEECLAVMDLFAREDIPVYWLARGDRLEFGDVVIDVCWPDGEKLRTGQDANDLPLVLSIDLGGCTILNTADLTGRYEMYAVQPCDVLKVAHHGSWDSTSPEFIAAADPSMAIVSCASGRVLPYPETLQRLADAGVDIFRTDENGDITIWMGRDGAVLSPYRK